MSFTPLPKIFTDALTPARSGPVRILELGCGDGRFGRLLSDHGAPCWGLDLVPPALGSTADLVGDALVPPVAAGSLDLLVAANLVRHLLPQDRSGAFLGRWLELLKPGGFLFIFEDEPTADPPGAARYRDLQEFLRRLAPESRGPLLTLAEFEARWAGAWPGATWAWGRERNRYPLAEAAVLDFLGQGGRPDGEPGRLMADIARDGLDPGRYWWARASVPKHGNGN